MKKLLWRLKGTKARPKFIYNDICYPKEPHWIRYNTTNEQKDIEKFKQYTYRPNKWAKVLYGITDN